MGIQMKRSVVRRTAATIASAGLILAVVPTTALAASTACAAGATCEGVATGSYGDTAWKIQMPAKFNGTVLLYSHGYRIKTPVPAALATPLGLPLSPEYSKIAFPAFASTFGSDVAYVGNSAAAVAPTAAAAAGLLAQGYALAGAGFASQGWATAEGVQAGELLLAHINGGGIAGVKKTLVWGSSLGGLITQTLAERNPTKIAGSLPTCAALAGPEQAFGSAMTVLYTWKTLIAPNLRVANYQSYGQALTDLGTVLTTLGGVAAGTVTTSAVGYPVAQANMLAALMAGLPTKSSVYDGQTVNPAFATMGTAAALAGGYSPASAGASTAGAMLQNVGAAAALGILGRFDLEQRARVIGSIPTTDSANFNDNVNVVYSKLLSDEQRGEFGDTLNASTVMPNLLNAMLAKLDSSTGNADLRFPANGAAVNAVRGLPAAKGVYKVPTVLITTEYDPIVPAGNTGGFYDKLAASHAKQGSGLFRVAQYYTAPSEDGYTKFAAGAKSVDAAASAAAAASGIGHCAFGVDNSAELIGAVSALNHLIFAKDASAIRATNRTTWQLPGVNGDGGYVPDPLKATAAATR
jgi:pimeloyl-ACP methyl ester carboxylesterase